MGEISLEQMFLFYLRDNAVSPSLPATPRHTKKKRYKKIKRAKKLWQLIEDLLREVGRDMDLKEIQLESR